ncbi:MAG: VWA domain-containing protein [Methylococcaceae bacterium]|nr:MAG: VWA domain-containing protein [Methylococcaceae bacterium]
MNKKCGIHRSNQTVFSASILAILAPALVSADTIHDIRVSYYDTAENLNARKAAIEDNIKAFANAMYEATNGAHRLGRVSIYPDGAYKDNTDVLWVQGCHPNAHVGGHKRSGYRIEHCDAFGDIDHLTNTVEGGNTLMHEWGHFAYALYDEYVNPDQPCSDDRPGSPCADDVPTTNSIMNSWTMGPDNTLGDLKELNFSTPVNFSMNTAQGRVYQSSAWETLVRDPSQDPTPRGRAFYPDLAAVAPAESTMPSLELGDSNNVAAATGALDIKFFDVSDAAASDAGQAAPQRAAGTGGQATDHTVRLLLIDHSNAVTVEQLEEIKAGVELIVQEAHPGEVISVITYDDGAVELVPATTITDQASKTPIIEAVKTVQSSTAAPALDNAFKLALHNLPADATHSSSIYIFGSGHNNGSVHPALDLVAQIGHHKTVIVNAFGTDNTSAVAMPLQLVAQKTHGTFVPFKTPEDIFKGLEAANQAATPVVDFGIAGGDLTVKGAKDVHFHVGENLSVLAMNLELKGATASAHLTVIDPHHTQHVLGASECGNVTKPKTTAAHSEEVHFCHAEFANPAAGNWTLHMADTKPLKVSYAIDGISAGNTAALSPHINYNGQTHTITAMLTGNYPVSGLHVTATAKDSHGKTHTLALKDDGHAPDEIAHDGIYSGKIAHPVAGGYSVAVHFDNKAGKAKAATDSTVMLFGLIPGLNNQCAFGPLNKNCNLNNDDETEAPVAPKDEYYTIKVGIQEYTCKVGVWDGLCQGGPGN